MEKPKTNGREPCKRCSGDGYCTGDKFGCHVCSGDGQDPTTPRSEEWLLYKFNQNGRIALTVVEVEARRHEAFNPHTCQHSWPDDGTCVITRLKWHDTASYFQYEGGGDPVGPVRPHIEAGSDDDIPF